MKVFSKTDIGKKRQVNQDHVYAQAEPLGCLPNLFVVADGMGGHRAGGYASACAVERIVYCVGESEDDTIPHVLADAVCDANAWIKKLSDGDERYYRMGTTVVAASLEGSLLHVMNVGDSRLYVIHPGGIEQITEDNSLVQEMVRSGSLTQEEARVHPGRHVITRAVGLEDVLNVDYYSKRLQAGDLVLLCSDGLTDMLEDGEIFGILSAGGSLSLRGEALIQAANSSGGMDNIAVLLLDPYA